MGNTSHFGSVEHPAKLDVVVVGAGLGGLSTAIATALSGHTVVVCETVKEIREVGAGLQVTPNATLILQRWGLMDLLEPAAAEPDSVFVHRYSGQILAREEHFSQTIRKRYSAPFVDLHRCDLQLALYERAIELGVEFRFGERVESVDFSKPEVRCESGTVIGGDLVVAADGLWSRCRACLLGRDDPPLPTGDLAYRVVLHVDQIEDPDLRSWVENPTVHFWIGPGAHAVGYSMRGGSMYNIVLLVPDDLPEGVSKQQGSIEEMRALFKGWDPILGRFLNLVENVDKWKLMHRDEMDSWINDQENFVFVGDACHPMLPYLAQGANSSVEDGACLGLLLGRIGSKDQLPEALKVYQSLRKTRGEAIVKETFKQRHDFHMHDGPGQEARDHKFLSQLDGPVKGPFPSRWTCPEVQPWLYGYDIFQEVDKAVAKSPLANSGKGAYRKPSIFERIITFLRGVVSRFIKGFRTS